MADQGSIATLKAAILAVLNNTVPDQSIDPSDHNTLLDDLLDTVTGLDKVLRTNNATGGYSLKISDADLLKLESGAFTGDVDTAALTGFQNYTFQDASGVVAFLSDIGAGVTNLSEGTSTTTSVDVDSDTGTNATLLAASTIRAGVMTSAKFDEVVLNNAKVSDINHNVTTNLSEGATTNTTVDVDSSDGTNATLAAASTTRAGLLSKAKFDEIVVNTAKAANVSTDLSEGTSTTTTVDVDSSDGTDATLQPASTIRAGVMTKTNFDDIALNNAKVSDINHNVTTDLSEGTTTNTSVDVNSSDGLNATLAAASTTRAGVMTKAKFDEVVVNNAKVSDINHNVSTDLSEGATTNTTVDVDSSDGTNATLASATTLRAGLLSKGKFDEVVANTLKVSDINHNVSTDLSEGTTTNTSVDVNSSDGTNATLAEASTTRAGVLSKAKFDEIVLNNAKVTNVTTDLSHLADTTQIVVNSSDGTNTTLIGATTLLAGVLTAAKWDEIVANTLKVTFPEAPNDGTQYTRKNLGWEAVAGASGIFGISDASGVYTYYATLTLAMAAAVSGDTVQQFADVLETADIFVMLPVDVHWNLNGFTYERNAVGGVNHAIGRPASSTNYITNGRINCYNGALSTTALIGLSGNSIVYGWGLTIDNNMGGSVANSTSPAVKSETHGVTVFNSSIYSSCAGGKYYNCNANSTGVGASFFRPEILFNCKAHSLNSHAVDALSGGHYDQVHITAVSGRCITNAANNTISNCYLFTDNGIGIYATGTGCKISNTYVKSMIGAGIAVASSAYSVELTNCKIIALTVYGIGVGQDSLIHGNYISSAGGSAVGIGARSICTNNTIICSYNNVNGHGISTENSTIGNEAVISGNRISVASTATNYIKSFVANLVKYSQNFGFGTVIPTTPVHANVTQAIVAIEDNQGNLFT